MQEEQERCRIYIALEAGPGAMERMLAALEATEIAACLIAPARTEALDPGAARRLVEAAQRAGAAALIADDAALARALHADGVHLSLPRVPEEAYALARACLGGGAILGADVGLSRHDAMTLAEAGVDYIAFGAPSHLRDRDKARARRDGLVEWWSEIFQVPGVAFDVETAEEAEALARLGVDFVAVRLESIGSPDQTRGIMEEIAAAIAPSLRPHAAIGTCAKS